MDKNKIINVGLIGCGVIGSGVVSLFSQNNNSNIKLKTVAEKDPEKPRKLKFSNVAANANEIIEDPEIDIVVELIGGYEPAREYIIKAINFINNRPSVLY